MDKAVAEIAKTLKGNLENLSVSVQQLCSVVLNQEKRLQLLEGLDVRIELKKITRKIVDIQDPEKKEGAMAEFAALCHALGIEDLETEP